MKKEKNNIESNFFNECLVEMRSSKGNSIRLVSVILLAFAIMFIMIPRLSSDAFAIGYNTTISLSTESKSYYYNNKNTIIDSEISINSIEGTINGATVTILNNKKDDILGNGELPEGITSRYDESKGVLSFYGSTTPSDWEEILSGVKFSTTSLNNEERIITFSLGAALPGKNGHFYEYVTNVSGAIKWSDAFTAAGDREYFGMKGYLATITSEEENELIRQKLNADAWIGASDDYNYIKNSSGSKIFSSQNDSEGKWYWVNGPEKGTQFSEGNNKLETKPGQYANWNQGEPNNLGGEHYGEIFASGNNTGKWNDLSDSSNILGYVVEYGGLETNPPAILQDTVTVTILKNIQTITFNGGDWQDKTYGVESFTLNAYVDSNLTLSFTSSNTNVATVDSNGTVTIKGAGTTDITVSQVGNDYYATATSVTKTLTVNKRPITVQATADIKTYDGTADSDEIPVITEGTLAPGETYVLSQKFDSKDASTNKTLIPSCKVLNELNVETTSNYNITISTTSGEITLADPTISLVNKTSTYTGSVISIEPASVTGVSGETPPGSITYVYYTDRACTTLTTPTNSGASANGQAPVYAGTYYVKATIAATQNYTSQTTAAPGTLSILPAKGEVLSLGNDLTKTYGDESFILISTGGSGTGTVSFTSSNPNVASVTTNGYVTINSVGETTISATKASDGNYNSQYASIKITVNKKTVAYTISNNNKTYTGVAQYADVTCNTARVAVGSDYSITYYQNNKVVESPIELGVYSIVVTTINSNYEGSKEGTLTITNAGQIDFGVGGIPQNVKYGDLFTVYPIGNVNGTTTYKINSGNATVDTATGLVIINGIGEVVIEATNIAENFEIKTSRATFTVQPKTISITAIATDRPFEEGNNNVDVKLITGVEGVTAAYISASVVTDDAGADKLVTVTGITLNNVNYKPESTTIYTKVTIGKILASVDLDITGLPSSITYEDDDFKLTATGQGTGEVIWSSSDRTVAKIKSTTGVVTIKGAGTAVITATKESDGNYEAISSNITIEVDKKDVTYSIINNTKIYNGLAQFAVVTPSAISLVEDVDYKVTYSQDDIEVDEPIEANVYDIYIETLNDNYDGESIGATLTILEANQTSPLVIGGLPNYIEYEDTFALYANGGNGEGNVNWAIESGNEYAEVTSGSGIVSITGVGTVTVSATKEGDGNYKDQVASVTFTTNKKQINVVISNTLKTYNGLEQGVTIKATPTSYNTFESLAEISYVNQADGKETEFKNVGTYNVLVDVNDDYSEYYELSGSLSAVASIKKADIIITADNKEKVYGEANPEFTMSYNLLGTDEKEIFEEPSITCVADRTSSVGEYNIVLSYEEENINSNYNVILSNGKLNVTPALLTVTVDDKSVYCGKGAPTYTFKISGFKVNDTVSDLMGSAVFSCDYTKGSAEGEYDINVSGFTSNNYNFEYVTGKLTVLSPSSSGGSSGSGGIVKPVEPIVVENQYDNPFEDVNEDDWFYEAIEYVNKAGLMSGTGITTFEPYLDTTRSMIVTILYRIEKEPDITKINSFNDIIIDSWYYDAIAWGAENGVVKGYDNETFGPNDKITREQLAAILYRYAMLKGYIVNEPIDLSIYQDYEKVSSWGIDSMQWAVSQGIITGTSPTTLNPQGYATRAQTAACLMRFIQNIIK